MNFLRQVWAILVPTERRGAIVLLAGTLGFAFWAFNRFVRSRFRRWADVRQRHARLFRQHSQQGLAGAKEANLHGCESGFIEQFSEHADSSARFATPQWAVEQAPRMWFEWLAVVAFRMLPSINHAAVAIQKFAGCRAGPERRRSLHSAEAFPEGIDTVVGERGVRLSGGQRQRIAIARALSHGSQVLVLAEATSALDGDTEREVMAVVEAIHGTKTLKIVAHRLSTVACCDVLHRLEGGRIVSSCSLAEVAPADPCDAR